VHRGVGAPRSPRRRPLLERGRQRLAGRLPQHQVSGGERVHFAERAHGQVVRGPGTDAWERAEPIDEALQRLGPLAEDLRRARDTADALARARVSPIFSSAAEASRSAVGNRCVSPSAGAGLGAPKDSTSRPANVVAARTLICCPRMARTQASNESHAPGMRRPGRARTDGPSRGSAASVAAICSGSASRSNIRRTRPAISSSSPRSRRNGVRVSASAFPRSGRTSSRPFSTFRRYPPESTASNPEWRALPGTRPAPASRTAAGMRAGA